MDALSESLRTIRLSGALLVDAQLPGQWCYQSPRPEALREDLLPGKSVLSFHLVLAGTCVASLPGQPPVQTHAGELLLFPHGEQHVLASSMHAFETLPPREVMCNALRSNGEEPTRGGGATTRLICGYLSCVGYDAIAAFAQLPNLVRVHGDEHFSAWMHASMTYCALALAAQKPTTTVIVERILETVLVHAMRQQLDAGDARSSQPAAPGKDRFLQRALALGPVNTSSAHQRRARS